MENMNGGKTYIALKMRTIARLIVMVNRNNKYNSDFDRISHIQDSQVNNKEYILNKDCSILCILGIVLIKSLDNIGVLNSAVNKSNDNNNENSNENNDSNTIDAKSNYNNDDYTYINSHKNNCDDDKNYDAIDDHKNNDNSENNNYCRTDYKTDSSHSTKNNTTQLNSISISNVDEFVQNINENIPSEIETKYTAINKFEPQSTEKVSNALLSTDEEQTKLLTSPFKSFVPNIITEEENIPSEPKTIDDPTPLPTSHFKSFVPNINAQEDIDDALCLPFSYQYMFDKRTSPWEMKDWEQEELNDFVIEPEKIDRLYHMVADDEDQNFRSWEICCRMDYRGEKYFVEMYANCDYTGFDCQGGGHVSITKLPDFFLENMVTMDQNPEQIYKSLREDGYNVQEPDLLHKVHPKFWNNAPMLKYLCHNAIYKHRDVLPHFKDELPKILANSVDEFIKVKDWDNE